MQRTFFDVTPEDLGALAPAEAVAVLREMIWAEASSLGLAITDVNCPFSITDADGGIDAAVDRVPPKAGSGLFKPPRTSYQVKTGDFTLRQDHEIEELLLKPASIKKRIAAKGKIGGWKYELDDINSRVRSCLDSGGTFVSLLFGDDSADRDEDTSEKAIKKFLSAIDAKYAGSSIEVWRQSKICGLLRQFPMVAARVRGQIVLQVLRHADWASRADMAFAFEAGPEQKATIEKLRATLRDNSAGSVHIRICGEPGIGKTRLVLEATRAPDLAAKVLYAENPSKLFGDVLPQLVTALDQIQTIIVADECDPDDRSSLLRQFKGRGPNIKIVSIYQDFEEADRSGEYLFFEAPRLPDEQIISIFKQYGVSETELRPWAEECQGSPRVAHVVGQNLRNHPNEPLREDGLIRVWSRYLAQGDDPGAAIYRKRHLVLSSLALFKRFGWSQYNRNQAYEVFDLIIRQLEAGLSKADFDETIDLLRRRKVLQGENVLYISPKLFHIRLWADWWNKYSAAINIPDLLGRLTPKMRDWFSEMFEYAQEAPTAKRVVADLFGNDGPFKDAEWLKTRDGGRFFFNLARADPHRALRFIESAIGNETREQLIELKESRRDIVWALEGFAIYPELFRGAAILLLQLGEAENETWGNNASGVFAGLFSLGWGELAPTALPPDQRLPVLEGALLATEGKAGLALKAFSQAFQVHGISRMIGHEWYATRHVKRWTPKTYEELYSVFRLYWVTLKGYLPKLSLPLFDEAIKVMLSHVRGLCLVPTLADEIVGTLEEFSALPNIDTKSLIETVENVLHYDHKDLESKTKARLEKLKDRLVGDNFGSQLHRYVGMDLLEDQFDEQGNQVDKISPHISRLAKTALSEPSLFVQELPWLVTDEAKNGYRFGKELGELNTNLSLWPAISDALVQADKKATDFFASGYLSAVFGRDQSAWEDLIEKLSENTKLVHLVPYLVWRSGMTEKISWFLFDLAKKKIFEPTSLRIFSYGSASAKVSTSALSAWINLLIEDPSYVSATAALDLAYMSSFQDRHKFDSEMLHRLVFNPGIFTRDSKGSRDTMAEHHWLGLAKMLIKSKPDEANGIARLMLENFSNEHSPIDAYWGESHSLLDKIMADHPVEVWRIASGLIGPPMDARAFSITRWLRGDDSFGRHREGGFSYVPRTEVWRWIEGDPEKRGLLLANFSPKNFSPVLWKGSLIRELLCRFGDRPNIRGGVHANFSTEGWHGPASLHYQGKKDLLLQIKADETDPNVLLWISEAIEHLDKMIIGSKVEEEERGF